MFDVCNKHVSSLLPETRLSDYRMKINVVSQIKNMKSIMKKGRLKYSKKYV